MKRIKIAHLNESHVGTTITIGGWVRSNRAQKNLAFIELSDGSCQKRMQIVADQSMAEFDALINKITVGSAIIAEGVVAQNPNKPEILEVQATSISIIGGADPEAYPLQKKRHSMEFLREIAHLRPRTNTFGAVFRLRHHLSMAVHQFFHERDFFYIHTPIITTSDCEGAGQLFQLKHFDPQNPDNKEEFFGQPAYLTVSGQLNVECFAQSLGNVYTFGPTFRAENSTTPRHIAEFWMIEPEVAFADFEDIQNLAEEFIHYLIRYALENCPEEMDFFNSWIEKGLIERLNKDLTSFERVPYTEAIQILKNANTKFSYPVEWGLDLQTEHERFLCEEHCKRPVIITDYPEQIKAFYMRRNEDDKTVAAMDVLVPKIGEIIGGSQREERQDVLLQKMQQLNLDPKEYWWYLELRKYGSVPHGGFGAGFERVIRYISGMENIRDVIPFPRYPKHAKF